MIARLLAYGALLIAASAPLSAADNFPTRPLRLIVPYPAGGPNDVLARMVSAKLTEAWNQQVIVDNRPGAGGNLAAAGEAAALRHGDQLLNERLDGLRLGKRGLDLAVLEEAGGEVAEHRATVIFLHAQLLAKYTVTHGWFLFVSVEGLGRHGRARMDSSVVRSTVQQTLGNGVA